MVSIADIALRPEEIAQTVERRPTGLSGVSQVRLQNLLPSIQASFNKVLGQSSQTLQQRGLQRTSALGEAISGVRGQQAEAEQSLIANLLGQDVQESLSRDTLATQTSQSNAARALQNRQFIEQLRSQEYAQSEAGNAARRAEAGASRAAGGALLGGLLGIPTGILGKGTANETQRSFGSDILGGIMGLL